MSNTRQVLEERRAGKEKKQKPSISRTEESITPVPNIKEIEPLLTMNDMRCEISLAKDKKQRKLHALPAVL